MAIKASKFFGNVKGGFKLGRSRPKVQARFLRAKVNKTQKVKSIKKFFRKTNQEKRTWIRRKSAILKRKAAEKSLQAGRNLKRRAKSALTSKGFNPLKFIMMIFAGWLINQLPKIMEGIKKFIEKVKPVFENLKEWVTGIIDFFKWIGGGVKDLWGKITNSVEKAEELKKKVGDKVNGLKSAFSNMKKGFDDLLKKARGEEASLKKDMDDLEKEVNEELKDTGQSTTDGKITAVKRDIDVAKKDSTPVKTKSKPKSRLTSTRRRSRGKLKSVPVTVVIRGESVVLQPGTVEYNNFFMPGGTKQKMLSAKYDAKLVKDSSGKPKIVTIDVPMPAKSSQSSPSYSGLNNSVDPDSVNSKDLALQAIEK